MKQKTFYFKQVQPNEYDALFFDSYGNPVKHGTEIIIEENYNYPHFNNRPAVVEWNKEKGLYTFRFIDGKSWGDTTNNFYGIHKFKVKLCQEQE